MSSRNNFTFPYIWNSLGFSTDNQKRNCRTDAVCYGDIGTSPLYTMKTVFSAEHGLPLNAANLLGIVSLILWGLTIIVSLKYVTLILRADNRGEGGIMALMSLALSSLPEKSRWQYPLLLIGVFGATMFYGDSVITPAISVLSVMTNSAAPISVRRSRIFTVSSSTGPFME